MGIRSRPTHSRSPTLVDTTVRQNFEQLTMLSQVNAVRGFAELCFAQHEVLVAVVTSARCSAA